MNKKILIVDDEPDIIEVVRYNLVKEGYEVITATSGEEALKQARSANPALLVLDLMLPGLDGLDVCQLLKGDKATSNLLVLMLSAKGEEEDVVKGLEIGADDYLTKPFSPKVLVARVNSLFRRLVVPVPGDADILQVEGLSINPRRHEFTVDQVMVELTSTEFKILHLLMKKAGWVFTRYQIVDLVHGEDYPVTDRSIDVQIVGLRKKLGEYGKYIETVRGVGYRFKDTAS